MSIASLRRRLARLGEGRSPDPLPRRGARASAVTPDDELGAALLWFAGHLDPSLRRRDPTLLIDGELADALIA
jgi:hypothetical protein